jgi:ubiquinone/menaquinone biosynthesis C-methylase UbiE
MTAHVNDSFLELYSSPDFGQSIDSDWMPWFVNGLDLGDHVFNLVAGPGFSLPGLRKAVAGRVTVAQADPAFTGRSLAEFADDTSINVVAADPLRLPFPDNGFSAATEIMSLHHIPSSGQQDQALAELVRVVRPGGLIAGLNPIDGPHFRRMNTDGASVPIDPLTFADRLRRAGVVEVELTVWSFVRFVGRAPALKAETR